MGLDSRDVTPQLVRILVHLSAEIRSFERVARALELLGHGVDSCTVRRVVGQVGNELLEHHESHAEDAQDKTVVVPELAVVS